MLACGVAVSLARGELETTLRPPVNDAPEARALAEEGDASGPISLSATAEVTSAYMWRGYRLEDAGIIFQPSATLGVALGSVGESSFAAKLGVWESIHSKKTGADTSTDVLRPWYESDITLGIEWNRGVWSAGLSYNWYASPSNAFETYEEILLSAAFDDADSLGVWAFAPSVSLGIETGKGLSDGIDKGVYAQLGIEPSVDWESGLLGTITFSFPCSAGLSLKDYYQNSAGDDQTFGFATIAAKASVPIPLPEACGAWTGYAQVTQWFLGSHAAASNEDDQAKTVLTLGVTAEW